MKKLMRLFAPLTLIGSMLFATAAMAGTTQTPHINNRQNRQQERIAQGVRSGQLTSAEAARLESKEAKIQREKANAKRDGVVTVRERRHIKRQLNKTNHKIYRTKHNRFVR